MKENRNHTTILNLVNMLQTRIENNINVDQDGEHFYVSIAGINTNDCMTIEWIPRRGYTTFLWRIPDLDNPNYDEKIILANGTLATGHFVLALNIFLRDPNGFIKFKKK